MRKLMSLKIENLNGSSALGEVSSRKISILHSKIFFLGRGGWET